MEADSKSISLERRKTDRKLRSCNAHEAQEVKIVAEYGYGGLVQDLSQETEVLRN